MNFSEYELRTLLNIVRSQINQNGGVCPIEPSNLRVSLEEKQVINKMKMKYGSDYINQLNIIQNNYVDLVGGKFKLPSFKKTSVPVKTSVPKTGSWLSRNTGVSAQPLKAAAGEAISTLGTTLVTTGVVIATSELAKQQAKSQVQQPQEVPQQVLVTATAQIPQQVPVTATALSQQVLDKDSRMAELEKIIQDSEGELLKLKDETLKLKTRIFDSKRELEELKKPVPIQGGGKPKKNKKEIKKEENKKELNKVIIENTLYTIDSLSDSE